MDVWIVIGVAFVGMACINVGRIWRASERFKQRDSGADEIPHAGVIRTVRYAGYGLMLLAIVLLLWIEKTGE